MALVDQDGVQGKICTVCTLWQPLDQFRVRKPAAGDGYFSQCKACERALRRAKRAANPEPHRERARRWKAANPERTQQARDRWREANRERERAQAVAKRLADPTMVQQKNRAYYSKHKPRLLRRQQQRRAEHPELNRAHARRRRARLRLTPGAHTEAEWQALKARYDYRCLCCGRREPEVTLTRDHVIPLGFPGSSDSIDNIQPLCGPCNAQKGRSIKEFRAA